MNLPPVDLPALHRLNRLRNQAPTAELTDLEERFDRDYGSGSRLAVYGTLAPGRANHAQVESIGGSWVSGLTVRGFVAELPWRAPWGAEFTYPALRTSISGPHVAIELLTSEELPRHWSRLDAFEGPGYHRILTPVFRDSEIVEVANLYESVTPLERAPCP